jgi:hypothetical protein
LGNCFGTFFDFVFWQSRFGGLFWEPFKNNYGGSIRETFFGSFLVWAHLKDLFEGFFLAHFETFGDFFFSLGALEGPFWSRAHFKNLFGLFLKHFYHKAFLKDLLHMKHLGMLNKSHYKFILGCQV